MSRIRRYSGVLFGENFGNMSWLWETRVYNSNENGTVIVNVCLQPNYLTLFKNTFTHAKTWRYELFHSNTFGAFWDEEQ